MKKAVMKRVGEVNARNDEVAAGRPRRRRQGDQQREQKEGTRQKLLVAARAVFAELSYTKASVDMIADEAGVSRTTFYRHYDGKFAIAMALFGAQEPEILALWEDIFKIQNPSIRDCRTWLSRFLAIVEPDKVLLAVLREMDATEPGADVQEFLFYDAVMKMMWGSKTRKVSKKSELEKAISTLFLLQIDQFIYTVCVRDWNINRQAMIEAMAIKVHQFLLFRQEGLAS